MAMLRTDRRIWLSCFSVLIWMFVAHTPSAARMAADYTLLQKTRGSSLILVGEVTELRATSVIVAVKKIWHGDHREPRIEVPWDKRQVFDLAYIDYHVGDEILLFANISKGVLEPFAGLQGSLVLKSGWARQYKDAIHKILELDVASMPAARGRVLVEMMKMNNWQSKMSALGEIYFNRLKRDYPRKMLIDPVLALTEDPDISVVYYAVQTLSRVGDKTVIPKLINLLESPRDGVTGIAFGVLREMTRAEFEFDFRDSREKRSEKAMQWRVWWEENKEKIVLSY